jgi:2-polyprenyl-6-methoxyphenol hydroxylase-like FAD-dependent oxidoreductase
MEKNGKQHAWDIPSRRTLDLLVVRRRAGAALLDTYEQERVPIAQRLLETTDRAFQAVVSNGWLPRLLRTKVIARVAATAMKFEPVRQFAYRTISQIGRSASAIPTARYRRR